MNRSKIRVAVCTELFPPANLGGGPIRTLAALVAKAPTGAVTAVFTSNTDLGESRSLDVPSDRWIGFANAKVRYIATNSPKASLLALIELQKFRPDVVYLNSLFNVRFSIFPLVLMRIGFLRHSKVLVAPRGELGHGALSMKSIKKRLFLRAFRFLGLEGKAVWHASSEREKSDIVQIMGPRARILVRENDTELPSTAEPPPPRAPGCFRAIYISRIVPIKGLKMLIEALSKVSTPFELDIYGPEEDLEYSRSCHAAADAAPVHISIRFLGPIKHASVRNTIANYDAMLFPSFGENFGHVVAESLSVSCPVVCADTTPWTPWIHSGGGTVVQSHTIPSWSSTVESYGQLNEVEIASRRVEAGDTFAAWQLEASRQPHLFELLSDELG